MRSVLAAVLLICFVPNVLLAEDDNPFKKDKVGDWVEYKMTGQNIEGTTKMTIVAKDGAASGYSSQFQFVPGRGDGVIFIMNLQGQSLGTATLAHDLLREVCGLPLPEGADE